MDEKTVLELKQELTKLKKAQVRIKRKFTFMLSVIAMLVLITATLAWCTLSNFASVNDITLKISTAPELYLDIENRGTDVSLWKKVLTNDMINTSLRAQNAPTLDQQLLDPGGPGGQDHPGQQWLPGWEQYFRGAPFHRSYTWRQWTSIRQPYGQHL